MNYANNDNCSSLTEGKTTSASSLANSGNEQINKQALLFSFKIPFYHRAQHTQKEETEADIN